MRSKSETGQVLGVHNCSLTVEEGEILVLMGLSGSGKSTLLRAVNGLNPVVRGQVQVRGENGLVDVTNADADTLRKIRLNSCCDGVSAIRAAAVAHSARKCRAGAGTGRDGQGRTPRKDRSAA